MTIVPSFVKVAQVSARATSSGILNFLVRARIEHYNNLLIHPFVIHKGKEHALQLYFSVEEAYLVALSSQIECRRSWAGVKPD